MTSLATTQPAAKLKKDTNGFWDKLTQLYQAKEKPTYSKEQTLYNFMGNIMSPSKKNSHVFCPQQGPNVAKELKKYALMTKMEAVSAILKLKGWEYKARKQEAKLSANAMTPSRLKPDVDADKKIKELTKKINCLELQEVEAFNNRDTSKAKALSQQRIKLKQQKQKRISVLTSRDLKMEQKKIIKQLDKLVVEYPTATDERRQEMNDEMNQGKARIAEIKKQLKEIDDSKMQKKKKKLSANEVADVMNDALTEMKQDEPEELTPAQRRKAQAERIAQLTSEDETEKLIDAAIDEHFKKTGIKGDENERKKIKEIVVGKYLLQMKATQNNDNEKKGSDDDEE